MTASKVADVMAKNPLTVSPSDTVGKADELMFENRFRQLPVVRDNVLLGIITDRDLRSFLSNSIFAPPDSREQVLNTPVEEIMTLRPITLSPEDDLEEALELLIGEKVGGLPVVDETEGLVGIVTYMDLLRCFLDRLQNE